MSNTDKWDSRFMEMAELVSTWSKDPSTQIGVVIVDPLRRIVSTGYNGFPRGLSDAPERYEERSMKYAHIVHGELNAILSADSRRLEGATLYLAGLPGPPCANCMKHILQTGIKRIVSTSGDYSERWLEDFSISFGMMEQVGIRYEEISNE